MKITTFLLIVLLPAFLFSQSWQQMGPEGGYFKEFTIHPTDANTVYAGSDDGGGVWKTINGGTSWDLLTADFPNMTGWNVVIDDSLPNVVYSCDLYGRYGLLKSINGGSSWSLSNNGLNTVYDKMVSGLVVKTSDTLFISTGESATSTPVRPGNGIYKSYDGGDTWIAAGLQGKTIPSIGKNEFGTIFAGSEDFGLYYTNDNGANWLVHPEVTAAGTIFEIETNSNIVLVASTEGVFLSTNYGINFVNIGLIGEFNFDACIHKTSPNIEVYSSTMTGLKHYSSLSGTWTTVAGTFFTDQIVIGITSDGTNVFCGGFSNSPIVKSTDGGSSWNTLATSPIATEVNDIYIDPVNSDNMFACLMGTYNLSGDFDRESIYETTDGGLNWNRTGPDAHALCITVNPLNPQAFYLGSFAQGVYKTTDGFNSFTQLSPNGVTVIDVIVSSEDTSVVLITEFDFGIPSTNIRRSNDGGNSFTAVSSIVANRLLFNPNDNDTVYAASSDGIHISTDFGLTFSPWILSGEDCLTLAINGNDLYTGTADGKLFKVTNAIPTDISGSWATPVEIKSILFEENDLFVGMSGAEKDTFMVLQGSIWHSINDGGSWSNITTNMTSTNIYGNNIIASDGHELFVGTYGGGVFKSSGLNLSASVEELNNAENITVYPNPATNIIQIEFNNKLLSNYSLHNVLGVDVLNETSLLSSSSGQFILDISKLEKGIYFVCFQTDSHNLTSLRFVKE